MLYRGIALTENAGKWYFEDLALAEAHDPKGPDIKCRQAWMAKLGAVKSRGARCLGRVCYGRGHRCGPWPYRNPICQAYKHKWGEWFDHAELFWLPESQEYVLAAQPYDVSLTDFRDMEAFAEAHGLAIDVSLEDAWWYPGRTPLVVWRRVTQ
jgi:hypothetical protein